MSEKLRSSDFLESLRSTGSSSFSSSLGGGFSLFLELFLLGCLATIVLAIDSGLTILVAYDSVLVDFYGDFCLVYFFEGKFSMYDPDFSDGGSTDFCDDYGTDTISSSLEST